MWENQVDMLNDLWEARAERDRWRKAAELSFNNFHDGGCPANPRQLENSKRFGYPYGTECDCGFDAYIEAVRGD